MASVGEDRIHVAAFPWLGSGHVNPMVELSRRLVQLGFRVTLIVSEPSYERLEPKLLGDDHIHLLSLPDFPPPTDGSMAAPEPIRKCLKAHLQQLHPPATCLISDWFQGWTQDLANELGMHRVGLVTGAAAAEAIFSRLASLVSEGIAPVIGNKGLDLPVTGIPGMDPFPRRHLPLVLHAEIPPALSAVLGGEVSRLNESLCVLVNTVEELEEQVIRARNNLVPYLATGPLLEARFLKEDDANFTSTLNDKELDILRWLDKHQPHSVLYVAFGSEISLPGEQVEKLAKALKESGCPFLWAIRRSFLKDASPGFYDEIVSSFGNNDKALVVEWAPQLYVLRHRAVGAFFTHSGFNSTIEGVCCGVPQLCWPCDAEQNVNARCLEENWKLGFRVAEGKNPTVTVQDIKAPITNIMDPQSTQATEVRKNAEHFQKLVRAAVGEGGSSHNNLLRFKKMLTRNFR